VTACEGANESACDSYRNHYQTLSSNAQTRGA